MPESEDELALTAWLPVAKIFRTHADASRGLRRQALPMNLISRNSRCRSGTTLQSARTSQALPLRCDCDVYVQRGATPYVVFGRGERAAMRVRGPVLITFDELARAAREYFDNGWGQDGVAIETFMQSGQGWGHLIEKSADIRRLRRMYFMRGR